jgi:hypothetical protein
VNELKDVGLLLLGWLFGLLAGPISEAIRRTRRRTELVDAIKAELRQCRHLMASLAFRLKSHIAEVDQDFLQWLVPIEEEEAQLSGDDRMIQSLRNLLETAALGKPVFEHNRAAAGISLTLKTHSLPLLDSALSDLVLIPVPLRREILAVREQLDLLNQEVAFLMVLHQQTFDSRIDLLNDNLIRQNLEKGYRTMADRAKDIAVRISRILAAGSE